MSRPLNLTTSSELLLLGHVIHSQAYGIRTWTPLVEQFCVCKHVLRPYFTFIFCKNQPVLDKDKPGGFLLLKFGQRDG